MFGAAAWNGTKRPQIEHQSCTSSTYSLVVSAAKVGTVVVCSDNVSTSFCSTPAMAWQYTIYVACVCGGVLSKADTSDDVSALNDERSL